VAGGGARWRAGHRGAPARRRQGRQRPAAYRERGTGRGIEREKREKGEREVRERVCLLILIRERERVREILIGGERGGGRVKGGGVEISREMEKRKGKRKREKGFI